jgi:uncharacterized membrane protein required for colicin V production
MWYDLLTLGILMYAMFRGAMKGIVWQLATIAALLMCFFFSGSLSAAVAPFIRVEPPLNQWIAMFILYLGFSFVSFGVARVAHEMIESMRIEALDRHLGAILGLVKGGMFSLFLTFFLVTLSHSARESIINSESGYVAAVVIDRLDPVIPGDLHALLEPYIRRLDAPEIEREHRDERLARDRRGDDYRGSLDRRELADDRADSRRDRDGVNHDGIDGDRVDRDRIDRDRSRRPLPDDRKDLGDKRPLDDDPASDSRADRDRHRADGRRVDDRKDTALDRDGNSRPAEYNRDDKRQGDDPFSAADADTVPRHRERHRAEDRPELRPSSDSTDDLAQSTIEENQWLASLPSLTDELKQMALKAWRKTRPERRRELTRRLSSGTVPDLIRKTLQEWLDGPPASAGETNGERADLEHAISRALVATKADRPAAIDDIEASLKGIPDDVALNVLRDWRADLLDKNSDPDPRTTDRSSLNDRILNQLSKSGVSLRSLDAATRERLHGSETR